MRRTISCTVAGVILLAALPASAQAPPSPPADERLPLQQARLLKDSRYRIGQIERVLEGAVEHGATIIRDRLRAIVPADMLLSESARARGFRLEGYGVFFDVEVPSLQGTLPWVFQTLDQNDLDLGNALRALRQAAGTDVNLQQALKRIELQLAPLASPSPAVAVADVRTDPTPAASSQPVDPILKDPNEAYRGAIREALIDAMLEHTRGLGLGPNELLTVAARRTDDRPRLSQAAQDAQTVLISVRGADLTAFLGGQISRDEAVKRVNVRVF